MNEIIKAPKLRFPQFTDAWEQRKFGDVGSVSMCKRVFKEETSLEGDIPFFKIGTFGGTPDAFISRELFEEYKAKFSYPEDGAILLSASGTIGRIVEFKGEEAYFQDSNIVWLSHDISVSNKFLKVLYPTVKWDGIEGSTIQRLYNDNFLKTKFMMPSLSEQEKLGEFFESVDNLITLHQRKLEQVKTFKSGMLQKMFPKDDELVPKLRFLGFTDAWEQRKLGEIAKITMGQSPDGSTYSEIPRDYILVQGNADLKDGWVAPRIWTTQKTKMADAGDLIMSVRAPAGAMGKTAYNVVLGRGVAGIKGNEFLFQSLVKMDNDGYWKRLAAGSTFESINSDAVNNAVIAIPQDIEEQRKIGDYLQNIDTLITLHQRKLRQLKEYKAGLLQQMFV